MIDESNFVLFGKEDYLFLNNGSNRVIEQIEGRCQFEDDFYTDVAAIHNRRQQLCQSISNADYMHIIVPSKEIVLNTLLPDSVLYKKYGNTPVENYLTVNKNNRCFYDPQILRDLHSSIQAYPKGDTHWTHSGAFHYIKNALSFFGQHQLINLIETLNIEKINDTQKGDLAVKIAGEVDSFPRLNVQNSTATFAFSNMTPNIGCLRIWINAHLKENKTKLLLLHDSSGMFLFWLLKDLFSEVIAIHTPDMDESFIAHYKPSHVLFIQTERFFTRKPDDQINWTQLLDTEANKKANLISGSWMLNKWIVFSNTQDIESL